jgi:REP element-mobilizing transposase RayT
MNQTRDCNKCFKYHNGTISKVCPLCSDYKFYENILCDLTRSAQQSDNQVECSAFKPNLQVVGEINEIYEVVNEDIKLDLSERQKWLKAYALQQWRSDPDLIFTKINFHVCLVTVNRENLLERVNKELIEISTIFDHVGDEFGGKVNFLCSGNDHLHIHIDSPPEYSADEVINKVIECSELAVKNEFPDLFSDNENIFAKSYFVETIG